MELSRQQYRLLMLYDFKRGLTVSQCHQNLVEAFGDPSPSEHTVKRWFHEFRQGNFTLEDEPRSGRPNEAVTPENIRLVEELIKEFRNITYEEIEMALGIGSHAVHSILHDHLGVRKLVSRWIPHLLTEEQKQARVDWCRFMIEKFDNGKSNRVYCLITGDETWIYSYDPGSKQQSRVWVFGHEQLPTKVIRQRSASKQMVAIFFRHSGIVKAVPLEQKRTVNAQWYCEVCLPQVFQKLEEERPSAGLHGILLHHDNARAHTAARTTDFLHERGVQLVGHPAYSPDLAPCDFFLFPEMKKHLQERRFDSAEQAVDFMMDVLDSMPKKLFSECFQKWFWRMHKCIEAGGDYFEKV